MKMLPAEIIKLFDCFLAKRGFKVEAVAIGGAALNIAGYIKRPTTDIDLLLPKISLELRNHAADFRREMEKEGILLAADWLNNGPDQFLNYLNKNWEKRTVQIFDGTAIKLRTLSKPELLSTKLIGLGDRTNRDEEDIVSMNPTRQEMIEAFGWAKKYDANPRWESHLRERLQPLLERLGYGL